MMTRTKSSVAGATRVPVAWRVAYWLVIAGTACGLYKAYQVGRDMRAMAQEQLEHTLADEDHGFCERFGMRAGSADYVACCRELSVIRQKQTERDRSAQGVL